MSTSQIADYEIDYGNSEIEHLVDDKIFEYSIIAKYGSSHYLDRKRIINRQKAERIDRVNEAKKNWFKNHKTLLRRKKGYKREIEREERGVSVDKSREEYYAKLDSLPKEKVKAACAQDLELFAEYYFRHYLQYPSGNHHYWLYQLFTNSTKIKKRGVKWAIAAPRGNAKSTLTTLIFPIWCIVYKKKNFIVILSSTASQAEDFLKEIKTELLGNKLLLKHFPECGRKTDTWRLDEIVTSNDIRVLALGSQSKILGRRHHAYRPDLVLADDLENQEHVISALTRERMMDWYTKEVLKAGSVDGTTDFYVIGTIKHEDSLLNHLLSPEEFHGWGKKIFKAVGSFADREDLWDEWEALYTNKEDPNRFETARQFYEDNKKDMMQGVKVLWEKGESYYNLMEIKLEGEISFFSEKMNSPRDRSKCLLELEDLRFYEDKELQDLDLIMFGALDPTVGKKATTKTDYAAIVTVGKHKETGRVFVIDTWARKLKIESQIKEVLRKHGRYNYHKFGVEANAFQVVIKDHLEKISRITNVHVPVQEIIQTSKESKETRIEWAYPFFTDGTVFFHKSQKKLLEQIVNFTPDGKSLLHDDLLDALTMALKLTLTKQFKYLTW